MSSLKVVGIVGRQELVLVVEDHCRKFKLAKKSDLKNLYCV